MSHVWIVNPFDPLPGSREQSGRYASLARLLRDAGHDVTWWTASFSHRFKAPVDATAIEAACRDERIAVRIVPTPAYTSHRSLRRVRSHQAYAVRFAEAARREPPPDVVVASNPPPPAAAAAADVAARSGARLIVDVQDIWLDTFARLIPRPVRWLSPVLLAPWVRANRKAYSMADAVVGVAGRYADEAARYGGGNARRLVVPLGAPLDEIDAATRAGRSLLPPRPPGEIRVLYSGSFLWSYDVLTVAQVAADFARRGIGHVRFVFSGRGESEGDVRRVTADLTNVTFLGFADFHDWAATMAACDVGWNAVRAGIDIFFPNKIFYYWAGGLAILNSIEGECAAAVARTQSGLTYRAGDAANAADTLLRLTGDHDRLAAMRRASRHSAETIWDRRVLYAPYVDLVTELAARPPRRGGHTVS